MTGWWNRKGLLSCVYNLKMNLSFIVLPFFGNFLTRFELNFQWLDRSAASHPPCFGCSLRKSKVLSKQLSARSLTQIPTSVKVRFALSATISRSESSTFPWAWHHFWEWCHFIMPNDFRMCLLKQLHLHHNYRKRKKIIIIDAVRTEAQSKQGAPMAKELKLWALKLLNCILLAIQLTIQLCSEGLGKEMCGLGTRLHLLPGSVSRRCNF